MMLLASRTLEAKSIGFPSLKKEKIFFKGGWVRKGFDPKQNFGTTIVINNIIHPMVEN